MITYRVLAFGTMEDNEGGGAFFQRTAVHNLLGDAIDDYCMVYNNPAYTGAIIISVEDHCWEVVQEFGTEGMSIVCGSLDNVETFTVEEAPRLVIV